MRKFTRRRSAGKGPTRTWASMTTGFAATGATATGASACFSMQAPTDVTNLTSDPPEDVTLLRIKGSFSVQLSAAVQSWILGLTVQDTDWTPSSAFFTDADKRWLWIRKFQNPTAALLEWFPPNIVNAGGSIFPFGGAGSESPTMIDITPKVRIEPGKALYFVFYETGTGNLTVVTTEMRVLFQRSRRR